MLRPLGSAIIVGVSEGENWETQINETTLVRVERRESHLLVHQTGAPQSVEETKALIATVTQAIRDTEISDLVLDNRETDAPRQHLMEMLRAFFTVSGPMRDVSLVLNSAPIRRRFNAVNTANASINVRAFGSVEEAEHWITGWRQWPEYGVCLYVLDDCLFGSLTTQVSEIVAYTAPTQLPTVPKDVLGILVIDSHLYRVLSSPSPPRTGDGDPSRLLLSRECQLALPAERTPFVGDLQICDAPEHGKEVRSSVGNLIWVDFSVLAKLYPSRES